MAGTKGTKEITTRWPVDEGLIAGTTRQTGTQINLVPEERSLVSKRLKDGIG